MTLLRNRSALATLLAGLWLGLWATSCGSEPEPTPPSAGALGRIERLALRPATGTAARNDSEHVATISAADGIDGWEIEADDSSVEVQERFDPRPALWLKSARRCAVAIPLPDDLPAFNQVAVAVYGRGDKKDLALNIRGRGWGVQTDAKRFPGQAVQIVVHEIGELRQQDGAPRELKLVFTGRVQEVGILGIELMRKPIARWLPDPAEGTGMVAIGHEGRRATGLGNDQPLEARFTPKAGETLRFVYGQPRDVRRPGEEPRLALRLSAGGPEPRPEPLVERWALPDDLDDEAEWQEVELELEPFVGREVTARFELLVEGDGESVMALGEPLLSAPSSDAPSVLLITSDTHRADYLGAATRSTGVRTPFLDQMIASGTFFTDCYSTTNITNPSHIAMMTATSPRDTGIINNISPLSAAAPTLAEAFREAGYLTFAAVSARHLADDLSGLGQGFDRLSSVDNQRDSTETIAILEEWLEGAQYRPVFAWLHIFDAHVPYFPPEEYRRLYYPTDKDPFDEDGPGLPPGAQAKWLKGLTDIDYAVALYKSEVTYLDEQLKAFVESSRFAKGLCALTADHGESLTSNNIYFEHKGLFPNTVSVPMILWGPGVPAGQRVDRRVSQLDLGRTLLDLSGIAAPEFPGASLLEQAKSEEEAPPRFAVSSHGHDASIQVGTWYLVLHLESPPKTRYDRPYHRHEVHLFDLESDPDCRFDIAKVNKRRAARMRRLLVDWLLGAKTESWNLGSAVVDAKDVEVLAGLGYADEGGELIGNQWFDAECACDYCQAYAKEE